MKKPKNDKEFYFYLVFNALNLCINFAHVLIFFMR